MKKNQDGKADNKEGMSGKVSSSTKSKERRVSVADLEKEKKAVLMERSPNPTPGSADERARLNEKLIEKANEITSSLTESTNACASLPPNPVPGASDHQDSAPITLSNINEEKSDDETQEQSENERYVEPEARIVENEEQKEENETFNNDPNLPTHESTVLKALGGKVAIAQKISVTNLDEKKEKGCKAVAKRYRKLVIFGLILLTAGIITAIVVPLITKNNDDGNKDNVNDDDDKPVLPNKIKEVAQQITPLSTLEDPTSFQFSALQWMIHNDTLVTLENFNQDKVLQRYICAVLYFATNGPTWKAQSIFLTNEDTCSWNKVVNGTVLGVRNCNDEGEVTSLYLVSITNGGIVPEEIGHLDKLTLLVLELNGLGGPIPRSIGRLLSLKSLYLDQNKNMNGTIPSEIGMLQNLTFVNLSDNQFSGPIPSSIGNLKSLTYLDFSYNRMVGTIPTEIGKLTEMNKVFLNQNDFTNTLPDEVSKLSDLRIGYFGRNSLTGNFSSLCSAVKTSAQIQADCMEDTVFNKPAEVECSCCKLCCMDTFEGCVPRNF